MAHVAFEGLCNFATEEGAVADAKDLRASSVGFRVSLLFRV